MARDAFGVEVEPEVEDTGTVRVLAPRYTRRLSDKVFIAFHHACDVNDLEVAEMLLRVMEFMTTRRPRPEDRNRRRNMQGLVAAHERLWHLRHREVD